MNRQYSFFYIIAFQLVSLFLGLTYAHAEAFYIDNYHVNITQHTDASFEVTETIHAVFTEKRHGLIRKIPYRYRITELPQEMEKAKRQYETNGYGHIFFNNIQVQSRPFTHQKQGDYIAIKIGDPTVDIIGNQTYIIKYTVYNAINFFDTRSEFYWNLLGSEWEVPIQKASFEIHFPNAIPNANNKKEFDFYAYNGAYGQQKTETVLKFDAQTNTLTGTLNTPLQPREGLTVGVKFPQNYLENKPLEAKMLANNFFVKKQNVNVKINADGTSDVTENYTFGYLNLTEIEYNINNKIENVGIAQTPKFLGGTYQYQIDQVQVTGAETCNGFFNKTNTICIKPPKNIDNEQNVTITYKIYGNALKNQESLNYYLQQFSKNAFDEPIAQSSFSIQLPPNVLANAVDFKPVITNYLYENEDQFGNPKKGKTPLIGANKGNVLTVNNGNEVLMPSEYIDLNLQLPKQSLGTQFFRELKLWWLNNKLLMLPLLMLYLMWQIWRRFGKDEPVTLVTEYYPPANIPPSEAGILIDDHLHDRDLMSLIAYWGARGYMSLKPITSTTMGIFKSNDYEFTMLKNLESTAPQYEKTFFSGIFKNGNPVLLSSLKQKFYNTMSAAREQLDDEIVRKSFYMPYTRGSSTFLQYIGGAIGLGGLPTGFAIERDLGLGMLISGAAVAAFGKYMTKKAPIGLEAYKKLAGFREFIKVAEKNKLEMFLKDDPTYFDKTLPYAIVFDLAEKWADKFEGLNVPPPQWYYGNTYSHRTFMHDLDEGMRNMGNVLTSTPPSSSGGSGFGGSGGGGFSGGGFGGGGGSSW